MTNEYLACPRRDFYDRPTTRWVILCTLANLGRLRQRGDRFTFEAFHDDEELEQCINGWLASATTLRGALAAIRHGNDSLCESRAAEARHDMECEGAWLRAAEYNPEHADEMAREDAMGLS